jgi:hypothetical protein
MQAFVVAWPFQKLIDGISVKLSKYLATISARLPVSCVYRQYSNPNVSFALALFYETFSSEGSAHPERTDPSG